MSSPQQPAKSGTNSMSAYIIGFTLSLMLTLVAYFSVVNEALTGRALLLMVVGLAVAQLLVQLVFFLHLGRENKPRLNLLIFSFAALVIGIVVIGSLWIMDNLNYHMMTPHEMDKHMLQEYDQGGI